MLLLQPPLVSSRFHSSLYFITRNHHSFHPPISVFSATASASLPSSSSSSSSYFSSWNGLDSSEEEDHDEEFSSEGVKPDVVTYTTLMKALIRVDKFQKVPGVYEEMVMSGCKPDRKARSMLRSALRYMKQTLRAS